MSTTGKLDCARVVAEIAPYKRIDGKQIRYIPREIFIIAIWIFKMTRDNIIRYRAYTDEELLVMLKLDDQLALGEIHSRYYAVLYAQAYKRFPYREEIRDIIQELFTYLWDNRNSLQPNNGLTAYLYSSVRNRILNLHRHQKIKGEYALSLHSFVIENNTTTDDLVRERELVHFINREISELPPQMRVIFELSRNEDLTHIQIAEKLGLSPLTVRTQIRNALRILRKKLGPNIFYILF